MEKRIAVIAPYEVGTFNLEEITKSAVEDLDVRVDVFNSKNSIQELTKNNYDLIVSYIDEKESSNQFMNNLIKEVHDKDTTIFALNYAENQIIESKKLKLIDYDANLNNQSQELKKQISDYFK